MKSKNFIQALVRTTGFFVLLICLLAIKVFPQSHFLINDAGIELQVAENTFQRLVLKYTVASLEFRPVKTVEGIFAEISINGTGFSEIPGNPRLPVKKELIEIPFGADPEIRILSQHYQEFGLSDLNINSLLVPTQLPVPKCEHEQPCFLLNREVYHLDEYYPESIVSVEILGIMRGTGIGRLCINPVRYNPLQSKIRIYDDLVIEITFKNADIIKTKKAKALTASPFFQSLSHGLLNYRPYSGKDSIAACPVKYVVVADTLFRDILKPFIEWKSRKGFRVIEAYTDDPAVGKTKESIKDYLESLYNTATPEDPPPVFVVFAGDVELIPTYYGTDLNHATDLYYCEYTGDFFPELYYGRLSASTPDQLKSQLDKILQYEQFNLPDPDFLEEVVMVAGMDGSHGYDWCNGQINYGTVNYFNQNHGLVSHTYLYPGSGNQAEGIKQDINNGVAFVNYTAHCSYDGWGNPAFISSEIGVLQNSGKYALFIGNCCSSAAFDQAECFGEALLRADNKGALGYIGATNSTYWDEDYYWAVGVGDISENPPSYLETSLGTYDRIFHDHGEPYDDWFTTTGQMVFAGNLAVTEGSLNSALYYWEVYCLLGDPSLMIYLSQPQEISASYTPIIPLGSNTFSVYTIPYGYVSVFSDGVLHGSCFADHSGFAEVDILPFMSADTVDLVITGQNHKPFFDEVVADNPQSSYVVLKDFSVSDILGNNNGEADYGEEIGLNIELMNIGNTSTLEITGILSTDDTLVNISQHNFQFGSISSGDSVFLKSIFSVKIDGLIEDQHKVLFNLEIQNQNDLDNIWNYSFNIIINAPVLKINGFVVDDENGNGNGRLEAGETAIIRINIANDGHCDAPYTLSTLATSNELLSIHNSIFYLDTLKTGVEKESMFSLTVAPEAITGTVIDLDYSLISGLYYQTREFFPMIGIIQEDFETGNFSRYDWEMNSATPWLVSGSGVFNGLYSAVSGTVQHMESSSIAISFNVTVDDSISFYRKVSSEAGFDKLEFFIDDIRKAEWSGELHWAKVVFAVPQGVHKFKWEYNKDYSSSSGQDRCWIDDIVFPPVSAVVSVEENPVNQMQRHEELTIIPNPCKEKALVRFFLGKASVVSLSIYNSFGQRLSTLVDVKSLNPGKHEFSIKNCNFQPGMYYCVLYTDESKLVTKFIVIE